MSNDLIINPQQVLQALENLEVRLRETIPAQIPAFLPSVPAFDFLHLQGGARSWTDQGTLEHYQHMQDLLTGLHGIGQDWCSTLLYQDHRLNLLSGMPHKYSACTTALASALRGHFSGIQIASAIQSIMPSQLLQHHNLAQYTGMVTGIPSFKPDQLDRLLEGLRTVPHWGIMVLAKPVARNTQASWFQFQLNEASRWHTLSKGQDAQVRAGLRTETVDRMTQRFLDVLEAQLSRYETGRTLGMWEVQTLYFAREQLTFFQLGSLLASLFGGEASKPEPLRTRPVVWGRGDGDNGVTVLTSVELAMLTTLPRREVFGFRQQHVVSFDLDRNATSNAAISLGRICDGLHPTPQHYLLEPAELSKHALVAGLTGSGKTTTVQHLLERLWVGSEHIPFLVIESSKAEYRRLRGHSQDGKRIEGRIPKLQIYTLGDERFAPFRINPFEFEYIDHERFSHIATHIDHLRAVFGAAFVLYAPMPYVLEMCLNEIYQDAGWDLISGINHRIPKDTPSSDLAQWPIFPTLSDLYLKIDQVVSRLDYSGEVETNVRAGLQARILSMMQGAKGRMLDTPRGVTMASLLGQPTVLELDALGNDQEKALIIGLIISRLNAYRRLFQSTSRPRTLRHVTVIEEAHRLLKNVSASGSSEGGDQAGHTVEQLCNLLSEVRAYGEGIIIAEQIPSKLAPDAVKNSSLKILHRITAVDDRTLLAGAINLSDAQATSLVALSPGTAVVSSEGEDHPFLVKIETTLSSRPLLDIHLPQPTALPSPWFSTPPSGVPATEQQQASLEHSLLKDGDYQQHWKQVWLCMLTDVSDARLESSLNTLSQKIRLWLIARGQTLTSTEREACIHRMHWLSLRQSLEKIGQQRGISFRILQTLLETVHPLAAHLEEEMGRERLRKSLRTVLNRTPRPYPVCSACTIPCLLEEIARPFDSAFMRNEVLSAEMDRQWKTPLLDSEDGLQGLIDLQGSIYNSYPLLMTEKIAFAQLKTCTLALILARSRLPSEDQRKLATYLYPLAERSKS